jgi:hypothetical protein
MQPNALLVRQNFIICKKWVLHLFGPIAYISIAGSKYGLVNVDDYSRFTWVFFLQDKSETREVLKKFLRRG